MKPVNFISIDEADKPRDGQTVEPVPSKPVRFFELTETGENQQRTAVVVENRIQRPDAVNFFEITDVDAGENASEPEQAAQLESSADSEPKPKHSSTVMIIEDDNIVATMLKHILTRRGYEIELVADGRQAAERIASDTPPAMVILDVMLPFVDGFELIEQIRQQDSWKKVPIIMLTAKTREEDIVRALDSGADDYIVKPFQPQALIARVKRFVSQE